MITFLKGILVKLTPLQVVLDVQDIGYEVNTCLSTSEILPPIGQTVKLFTFVVYREDAQCLYGFAQPQERDFFRLLVEKASGIGPKIALSMMSKTTVATLTHAIANADIDLLSQCPGIGKKTAERLSLELRDKVISLGTSTPTFPSSQANTLSNQDAIAALVSLGYKTQEADKSIRKITAKCEASLTTEELVKMALAK